MVSKDFTAFSRQIKGSCIIMTSKANVRTKMMNLIEGNISKLTIAEKKLLEALGTIIIVQYYSVE